MPHSLLFVGMDVGEIAFRFAVDLIGSATSRPISRDSHNHPDLHLYHPEGKTGMHSISSLRKLKQEIILSPFEGKWKVFIIHEAERMLPTSANALLKTFEEPPEYSVIILLSSFPEKILPTILSRCQTIYFPNPPERKVTELQYQLLDFLSDERSLDEVEEVVLALEEKKKQWTKELRRSLPEDLTPQQKEVYYNELEGVVALRYQEKAFLLLDTILLWYRDRTLIELEGGDRYLTFPERVAQLKKTPYIPLDQVEAMICKSRLALERSIKLTTCLKTLLIQLKV